MCPPPRPLPSTQAQGWVLLALLGLCWEGVAWEEPQQELIAVTWRDVLVGGLPQLEPTPCPHCCRVLARSGMGAGGSPAVLCHQDLGMEGMCCSALGCEQGRELYAVPPRTQVNSTLDTTPAKVQEQCQNVVTSKQSFVPRVLNSPSPGLHIPFSSHPCWETCPAATPLSPLAIMLMPSLTKASPFPSSPSPCCPRLTRPSCAGPGQQFTAPTCPHPL